MNSQKTTKTRGILNAPFYECSFINQACIVIVRESNERTPFSTEKKE